MNFSTPKLAENVAHAIAEGWIIHSSNGNNSIVHLSQESTYPILLTLRENGNAELFATAGIVQLSVPDFSYPNPNFPKFMAQMEHCYWGCHFAH